MTVAIFALRWGGGGGGRCQSVAMVEGGETGDSGYICLTVGGGGGGGVSQWPW